MIKIVDRLLTKSFIPPFIVTFGIAIFFFLMQTLWFYIDDIAGKGLGFFFVIELLAYKCVSLIPMALPLAILISSVMVMGNMAEQYELSSMKSAGVRLLRIMRPLIIFGIGAALLSYYCSATLIPLANLKFGSRMYDIKQQKPAMTLDEGVFNDDFQGFTIHIGRKGADGKSIEHVIIYDHSEASKGQYTEITADAGEMYTTNDGRYFIMNLRDGYQYVELIPTTPTRTSGKYPLVRTSFSSWTKVFDMGEFDLSRTNEELFKNNKSMMSIPELAREIDSMDIRIDDRTFALSSQVNTFFSFLPADSIVVLTYEEKVKLDSHARGAERIMENPDSLQKDSMATDTMFAVQSDISFPDRKLISTPIKQLDPPKRNYNIPPRRPEFPENMVQNLDKPLTEYDRFAATFKKDQQKRLYDRSKTYILSLSNQAEAAVRNMTAMRETQVKYSYEMWTKYSIAVVCIIFVFIGAPMGAIVRKGGFGYPILISIIFFMIFVILTIFCRKIAEAFVLPAPAAAWVPAIVLFPIGLILTFKAMNDSSLQLSEIFSRFSSKLKLFRKKKKTNAST